jgi:hypothetical protein
MQRRAAAGSVLLKRVAQVLESARIRGYGDCNANRKWNLRR